MIGVALRIFFAVAGSWIIKAGFIKYFTKVSYKKAALVSTWMVGMSFVTNLILFPGYVELFKNRSISIVTYIIFVSLHALINWLVGEAMIGWKSVKSKSKLKFITPYTWLFIANAISGANYWLQEKLVSL